MPTNQKGIAHLFILLVLAIGILVGMYAVANPTFFKPKAAEPTTIPIYRLYNPQLNLWTWSSDQNEINDYVSHGYQNYGILFYAFSPVNPPSGAVPLYQLKGTTNSYSQKFMTANQNEIYTLLSSNNRDHVITWSQENIAFYAYYPGLQSTQSIPIYRVRLNNPSSQYNSTYYFTSDQTEVQNLVNTGIYVNEGVVFYGYIPTQDAAPSPSLSPTPSPTPNPLNNGLISYWNLDEESGNVVADLTGKNNGTATGTTIREGKIGRARDFKGSIDVVRLSSSLGLNPTKAITASAWVNQRTGESTQSILGKGSAWSMDLIGTDETYSSPSYVSFKIFQPGYSTFSCRSDQTINQNSWNHIISTFDSKNVQLFINGKLMKTCQFTSTIPVTSDKIGSGIGLSYFWNGTTKSFQGLIDEVGVWDRALTGEEIMLLANGASPTVGHEDTGGGGSSSPSPSASPVPTPTPCPANSTTCKAAKITANPNPCTLGENGLCTAKISWTSTNAPDLKIIVHDKTNTGLFGQAASYTMDAPWITENGDLFEAISGNQVLDRLFVKGIKSGSAGGNETGATCFARTAGNDSFDTCSTGYSCNSVGGSAGCADSTVGSCYISGSCKKN